MLYGTILTKSETKDHLVACAQEIALRHDDAPHILSLIDSGEIKIAFARAHGLSFWERNKDAGKMVAATIRGKELTTVFVGFDMPVPRQADAIANGIRKIERAKHPAPKMQSLLAWRDQLGD
jgi:hypothetical protein